MKKTVLALVVGIAIGGVGVWAWLRPAPEMTEPAPRPGEKEPAQSDASTDVKIDPAMQVSLGIKTTRLVRRAVAAEVKGYGRVLDSTPLATSLLEIDAAEAGLEASKKDYDRVKTLFAGDQNASARTLEVAAAALKRDEALLQVTRAKLAAAWGHPLIEQPDLRTLVGSLMSHDAVLIRVDLPSSEALTTPPTGARIVSLASDERTANAEFVGLATSADPQVQGQGFLFLLKQNALGLRPEMAVVGYLATGGDPLQGFFIPRSAVVRSEEKAWVYVLRDVTRFIKTPVELDRAVAEGWFISENLTEGEAVVTSGAQILLSEESKARYPLAD